MKRNGYCMYVCSIDCIDGYEVYGKPFSPIVCQVLAMKDPFKCLGEAVCNIERPKDLVEGDKALLYLLL